LCSLQGPHSGQYVACGDLIRKYTRPKVGELLVLRCEKMLKCVHDYFVYLK
jgi:hypothetical protein